jgi:acyl dehydratase
VSRRITSHRTISADDIRAYSRRGNYHSDAGTAQEIGLPGLVAQGVQVAGPAYSALLDAWGEDFLAHGEIDLRFVGMVLAGDEIETTVTIDDEHAELQVRNESRSYVAVVGDGRASVEVTPR